MRPYIDSVITFEELQALFDGAGVDITALGESALDNASYFGRIFARSGGLSDAVAEALRERGHATFKVFARRADKRFPMRSADICAELGGLPLDRFAQLKVDVHAPELRVGVEIRQERAFVYAGEIMGPGGMPVGCNGRALLLLSGGIDSPVAGYMIAKRGVAVDAIHSVSYTHLTLPTKA